MLMPADRLVPSLDHAVAAVMAGTRRAFEVGAEEWSCHLLVADWTGADAIVSVVTCDSREMLPHNTVAAARACAAKLVAHAAIWVEPGYARDDGMSVLIERPNKFEVCVAKPSDLVPYSLAEFSPPRTVAADEYTQVALPINVVAYARAFGLDGRAVLGPTRHELRVARNALAHVRCSPQPPEGSE